MARLTRATQKIFAGNATNNGVFGSLQAGSGQVSNDVETIQSLPAYEQGWNAATISSELLPPLEEFQGVQYANSYQLAYNYQEGIPEWDSGTTYYIGSVVKVITSTGYQLYHSLTDNNVGNATSNQSYWELDFDSATGYALRDLSNSTAITNCITKIPQDIKLELNNGTLTLKAGSTPRDGSGNVINVTSDIVISYGSPVEDLVLCVSISGTGVEATKLKYCSSGTTAPTAQSYRQIWYDTANKKVYTYPPNSSEREEVSFPIAIVNHLGEGNFSIVQVFNGFVYIGNVTRILPGVECLMSYGRNADGSLNSLKATITQVVAPELDTDIERIDYYIKGDNSAVSVGKHKYIYDNVNNVFYFVDDDNAIRNVCFAYSVTKDSTGRITSLTPKTCFHAVDYYDAAKVTSSNTFQQPNTYNTGSVNCVNLQSNNIDSTSNPSSELFSNYVNLTDINGVVCGRIGLNKMSNGYQGVFIQGVNSSRLSTLKMLTNGTSTLTSAPTPPASDNSTQIATTAWVNSFVGAQGYDYSNQTPVPNNAVYTTPSKGAFICYASNVNDNNLVNIRYGATSASTGTLVAFSPTGGYNKGNCVFIPVMKGDNYWVGYGGSEVVLFVPSL